MTETTRRAMIAGNWKMNGVTASEAELATLIANLSAQPTVAEIVVCPPATLIARFAARAAGTAVAIGGQDCHSAASGAHTGDLSAEMLKDAGANYVIVGHSERRQDHNETDEMVLGKVEAARRAGLVAIVCIGETLRDREQGHTLSVLGRQVAESFPDFFTPREVVVAYEPVWAIGTGKTPTNTEIQAAHAYIRDKLRTHCGALADTVRILYGGSVKPGNAKEILTLPDVDGALVGGASLKAADFLGIIHAL
jgi:triosephosphate isomerase